MDQRLVVALRKVIADTSIVVYHGSDNSDIVEFKKGMKTSRFLLFKEWKVESQGIFFTFDPEIAEEFGRYVYEVEIAKPNLFIRLDEKNVGVERLDSKREKQLAEMLQSIAKDNEINLYEKDIFVPDNFDPSIQEEGSQPGDNWGWIYDALGDGILWDVLDEPAFVKKMEAFGYDGTVSDESSEHGGKSLFLSNLSLIKNIQPLSQDD